MADRRRIITLSNGGRPVLDVDLEVASAYQAISETFAYQPGANNQMTSREPTRFGGQVIVGEQNDNGTVSWQALVRGSTVDQVAANIEAILTAANRTSQSRLLEWRPDGNSYSSYFRIAGPGTWKPTYKWSQWQGAQSMVIDVSFPVRPLVLWDPMTIIDPFDVDSRGDYTFDAATSADVSVSGGTLGTLIPVVGAALTVERGARHTVRGYDLLEGQATVKTTPGATITGYKAGVRLRASAANTYIEVYLDDNGTNSRLRIDVVIAGVRTNRSSTNLAARLSNGTPAWVRARVEGIVVYAEHFNSFPTPMLAPTTSLTGYSLVAGDAPLDSTAGKAGWSWVPQHATAKLDDFEFRPFTYRNQALPQAIDTLDVIPGSAPALADVLVTTSGGTDAPAWGMIAWGKAPASTSSAPCIIDAEFMISSGSGSAGAQAGARLGNDFRVTGPGTFNLSQSMTVSDLEPDDFVDGTVDVEVWARLIVSSTTVNPTVRAQMSGNFTSFDTQEFGSAGKTVTKPSSGTVYRPVRLGVITVDTGSLSFLLRVIGTADTGSTGAFGMDYVWANLARRRATVMTGVAASQVGSFMTTTSEATKRVRSDLSAFSYISGGTQPERSSGMGGSLIQPSPGRNRWLVKLSSLIPDDPSNLSTGEQLAHSATVGIDVVPRSYMLRGA